MFLAWHVSTVLGLNHFPPIVSLTTKTSMYPNHMMPPHTALRFVNWESSAQSYKVIIWIGQQAKYNGERKHNTRAPQGTTSHRETWSRKYPQTLHPIDINFSTKGTGLINKRHPGQTYVTRLSIKYRGYTFILDSEFTDQPPKMRT